MANAVARFLAAVLQVVTAFFAGTLLERNRGNEATLRRVEDAMRTAGDNSTRPIDERLRDAERRGLYRVSGEATGTE